MVSSASFKNSLKNNVSISFLPVEGNPIRRSQASDDLHYFLTQDAHNDVRSSSDQSLQKKSDTPEIKELIISRNSSPMFIPFPMA